MIWWMRVARLRRNLRSPLSREHHMNRDFRIIFEKRDEEVGKAALSSGPGAVVLSAVTLVELDELAELRRLVAEITEPDPLSFTTT